MPFPDSLTSFDRIDISDSVDMVEKLDGIMTGITATNDNILLMKSTQNDMKECLDVLCSKESISASNDAGWTVLI